MAQEHNFYYGGITLSVEDIYREIKKNETDDDDDEDDDDETQPGKCALFWIESLLMHKN